MCWYNGFICNYQCSIAVIKLQFSPICRPLASAAWCGPHPPHHPRYASGDSRGISFNIEYSITVESLAYHDSHRPRPEVPNNCHIATAASQIITRSSHKHHMLIGRQKACYWRIGRRCDGSSPQGDKAPAGYTLVQYLAGRQ